MFKLTRNTGILSIKRGKRALTPRMSLIVLLLSCLVVWSSNVLAQETGSVAGRVTDAKSKSPLPNVNITVLGTQLGTTTHGDGTYRLKLNPGTYEIQASFVGYNTAKAKISVSADGTVSKDFSLEDNLIGMGEVVVTGTRSSDRTVVESPVPIDIISAAEIRSAGYTQTTQILKLLIPSYNAPQPSISDGTDHVRPATLRGLGPDQVLILINGKRRHTSALVHVNGTVGRGSTGVDLNAIPVSAIERVEVLRDGAAAQYGSDAISGVINIILKKNSGFDATASYGQYLSTTTRGYTQSEGNRPNETTNFASGTYDAKRWDGDGKQEEVTYTDGKASTVHLGYGLPVGEGTLYLSGSYRAKDPTNRSGQDPRTQYSSSVPGNEQAFNPLGEGFRINHKFGESDFKDASVFFNGVYPIEGGTVVYVFGGVSNRKGQSAGFYRRANDARNVPQIYSDGFLPHIESDINDASVSVGVKGSVGGWTYDLSETYGRNSFNFRVTNSLNTSFWTKSPREFDAGTLKFAQSTTNLDLFRAVDIGREHPLNIAVGAEFRADNYQIVEGQFESYARGDSTSKATGAQVFPGFAPSNRQDQSRSNFGLYADLEHKINATWMASVAARFENYSDFGSTTTAKFATRYELTHAFALRGAVSTGFRAPSLAQAYFSAISTNFIGGVPFEIGTFPVNTSVAKALGAKDLKAEKSTNLSAGITYNVENFSATVDAYQININDRIVFTENFVEPSVRTYLQSLGINAAGGRYFTNAVNTKTQGLDITARYGFTLGDMGTVRLTAALNFNKTEITNKDAIVTPQVLRNITTVPLFARIEQGRFEVGQPRSSYNFMANYTSGKFDAMVRTIRFGEVTSYTNNTDLTLDQTYSAKWVIDVEAGYKLMRDVKLSVGANNVFDVYPDKVLKVNSTNGILRYSGLSPFGFNGRFIYGRMSYSM